MNTSEKVIVLVPEAPPPAVKEAISKRARLSLDKLNIGFLDNGKGNADHLLRVVLGGLQNEIGVKSSLTLRKTSVSLAAQREILDRFTAECDLVITAMAD